MTAVAHHIPRRWSIEVDGVRWLPRMIDKARMSARGTLGAYLLGHSPVDRALLERLRVDTDGFTRIALENADDAAVWDALRARGADEVRVRRWSERFPRTYRLYTHLWDIDEGHTAPNPIERALLAISRAVERPVMALVRRLSPRP
jgi:hypothetical protein